ncbi:NAD(P)/FAD-dependent oxidoreductase [Caulobacter sp. KR2-114]|uniref:NAD(P)/FAD-dependent oxidoreductase n=1 Tax=Caulobacter sp. KR2-114 TaxID=3400912 RepID=UPI003C030BE4
MSDPVIVGGGLAGGAAAALLAAAGRRPLVLEREREPKDKICGEFLSTEAQAHLAALGLDLARLGGAPIGGVRMVAGGRSVERPLPFRALGLTRKRLDEALLEHAGALGAQVRRGVSARAVGEGRLETSEGALTAPRLLLASGKHDVRGARREPSAGTLRGMVGFKSYFRLEPRQAAALAGFVEVVLFDGGYAGLQPVEDGLANLCLVIRQGAFEALGKTWPALQARLVDEPHLARRLEGAQAVSPRPLTVADIPYGHVHRGGGPDGLYRLGDQAAVIPSFSGDGMAIALHSARLAAQAVLQGAGAGAYHRRLADDVGRQIRLAVWLQRRAEGWPGRHAAVGALGLVPAALPRLAAWTRVPEAALRRAGLGVA